MPSAEEIARGAKRPTKKTDKSTRFDQLKARSGGVVDITAQDVRVLGGAVQAVVGDGGAIMFGMTSDGGALVVTLYEGDDRKKEYLHGHEEIEQFLMGVIELYTS